MHSLITIFNITLYQPLFNGLVLLYIYIPGHNFGIAVILLTLLIRLLLYPLSLKSIESQKSLQKLQPEIRKIQLKYKNKAKQNEELMKFYREKEFNPFGGCLPTLIQLPLLIALYRVFWRGLQPQQLKLLYGFVPHIATINPMFLGIDLSSPNIVLAVLAAIGQFIQSKMMMPTKAALKEPKEKMSQFSQGMQKQMLYLLPLFTFFILWKLPSAIGLYWTATVVFSVIQQYIVLKKK